MKPSILFTGAALLASSASTFPNAAAILKGSGVQLSNEDLAKFNAVSEDVANAEKLFQEYQILRKRYQKRDSTNLARGLKLPLGGGLVNGKLQPFTGVLSGLPVPVPQPFGLKKIPGDDPNQPVSEARKD